MVVGLLAPRGIDFLTAMFAIFKAGGAYLPLDPEYPAHRIHQVLAQSQTHLVLATGTLVPVLTEALADVGSQPKLLVLEELDQRHRQNQLTSSRTKTVGHTTCLIQWLPTNNRLNFSLNMALNTRLG